MSNYPNPDPKWGKYPFPGLFRYTWSWIKGETSKYDPNSYSMQRGFNSLFLTVTIAGIIDWYGTSPKPGSQPLRPNFLTYSSCVLPIRVLGWSVFSLAVFAQSVHTRKRHWTRRGGMIDGILPQGDSFSG
jgi:hypothetical protein